MKGDKTILDELLQEDPLILHRVSLTSFNETPLHIAAMCGNLDFVTAILSTTDDRNRNPSSTSSPANYFLTKSDSSGRYPLHLACAGGHVEIVKKLYRACPEVSEIRDLDGRTPLELAAVNEHVEVLSFLLRENHPSGSGLQQVATITEEEKENVLHLCVRYNATKALKLLVDSWSNIKDEVVNYKDEHGNTLLHLAVIHQQVEMVMYLISEAGFGESSCTALNKDGFTAIDVLDYCPRNFRSLNIPEILLRAGIRRAKDLPNNLYSRSSSSSATPTKLIIQESSTSLPYWIEKTRGNMMVVATLIASICFQSGLNPPGGVWQDSSDGHQPGTSIIALSRTWYYKFFVFLNTSSFILSLSTIISSMVLPVITMFSAYAMSTLMSAAVAFLVFAYMTSLSMVTPTSIHGDYGLQMITWLSLCYLIPTILWAVHYLLRPRNSKFLRFFINGRCALERTKKEVGNENTHSV